MAAFWAGAAHPRRQKHREMPPPGAPAPAFAATVEPASTQISFGTPPTCLQSDSSNERVLKMYCCMHRFLISGSDLEIDAGFCLFTPSSVHRFLISSPNLRIDARVSRFTATCVHRFLISGPDLGIDARFHPIMHCCVHRFLISNPDLGIDARFHPIMPCCMHRFLISRPDLGIDAAENSFACSSRCCSDLPRPILISVATKENGFACNGRGGYEVRFRF